jgi:glutamate-1-semialdehyde 2,1-aminomutase
MTGAGGGGLAEGEHLKGPRRSKELYDRARQLMPGGVNSPVRAFRSVGGTPVFIERGQGAHLWDADGNRYTDYLCSWGALILGHARPEVVKAASEAVRKGSTFGAPTELEVSLAEMIIAALPSVEMVRLVTSGTEAVMSAVRLARAATKRRKIVKFEGGYHGHGDSLLVRAGSGAAALRLPQGRPDQSRGAVMGVADSPGVTEGTASDTIVAAYNDLESVGAAFDAHGEDIACLIVEPVAGNMGVVPPIRPDTVGAQGAPEGPPGPGFLQELRRLTLENGSLLIFDEVITGFRVAYGGAQTLWGITPDLTCLGKVIGGGFPLAAYGGRKELMELVAPSGPVYQAGTLAGAPPSVAAGIATLNLLAQPSLSADWRTGFYEKLERTSASLCRGLQQAAEKADCPVTINRVGSMFTVFFTSDRVTDFASACASRSEAYSAFFHGMLRRGVYFPPSRLESAFVSSAHADEDIERTLEAAEAAFSEAAQA